MKDKKTSSNMNLIMRIYLFFFMGVGLIMMIIGVYSLSQYFYKSKLLAKYPLGGYEQRCDYLKTNSLAIPTEKSGLSMEESDESIAKEKKAIEECEASVVEEREIKKVTDLYNSIITLLIGSVLFTSHLFVNVKTNNKS